MYIPNNIEQTLSGGFDMGAYSIILSALNQNYGVFHIDYGRDENGVPFGEIGLASPYPIQSIFPHMTWDSFFEPDHELNEEEVEFYNNMAKLYDDKVFPIVTVDIKVPEEPSRKFVSGIEGINQEEEMEDGQEFAYNIHTWIGQSELNEVIVRCSFEEEPYMNLRVGNTLLQDASAFETFIMWYLAKWLSVQPRISTNEHLD